MKIAVEGCCHGCLDATYSRIIDLERRNGYKIDLLIIGGDFEALRNQADLDCMAVPIKYRHMGDFYKYYSGQVKAPILTLVIGGNHEASNYLWELYHGGWLAPNIYYLGGAGCVNVNGVRIAGISGIYNGRNYRLGHHEKVPYDSSALRSIYHTRQYDIAKLSQLSPPDIFLSHDWPRGIEHHGNLQWLLKTKPGFKSDIESGELGSPPLLDLMQKLRPKRWFSAHMHVRFEATFKHGQGEGASLSSTSGALPQAEANPDEIQIDDDEFDDAPAPAPAPAPSSSTSIPPDVSLGASETLFLALDKCLPKRQYLEVLDIDAPLQSIPPPPPPLPPANEDTDPTFITEDSSSSLASLSLPVSFGKQKPAIAEASASTSVAIEERSTPILTFDKEWLAISRAMHPYLSTKAREIDIPAEAKLQSELEEAKTWIESTVYADDPLEPNEELSSIGKKVEDVQQFLHTAQAVTSPKGGPRIPLMWYTNRQTEAFCTLIGVENKVNPVPPPESS